MQVVIPAGYNKHFPVMRRPQAFLELAGQVVFETILKKLEGHQVIVVTPFPDEFKKYDVQVVEEESTGSASALREVDRLVEEDFAVHYSDIFTPSRLEPLIAFHREKNPYMTMALASTKNPCRYGVASTDPSGRVVRFLHEPRPDLVFSEKVSAGMMVLNRKVYDKIPYKMEMPELVTSLVATYRGKVDLAIGNVVGSNLLNLFLILGVCATASGGRGLAVDPVLIQRDLPVMVVTTLACLPIFWSHGQITRLEGGILVMLYALYLGEQVLSNSVSSLTDEYRLIALTAVVPLVLVFLVWQALRWRHERKAGV